MVFNAWFINMKPIQKIHGCQVMDFLLITALIFRHGWRFPKKKEKPVGIVPREALENQPNLRKPSLTGKKPPIIWRGEIYGFRFRGKPRKPCKSVKCVRYWMGNSSYSANVNSCDGTTKNAEVSHGVTICKYWGTWAGKMLDKWRISRWLIGLASVHPKGIIWNYQLKKLGLHPGEISGCFLWEWYESWWQTSSNSPGTIHHAATQNGGFPARHGGTQ